MRYHVGLHQEHLEQRLFEVATVGAGGGVVDVVARLWAEEAKQRLGKDILSWVQNMMEPDDIAKMVKFLKAKPGWYEKNAKAGGLMRYGIPDFKICKVLPVCPLPSGCVVRIESPPAKSGFERLVILLLLLAKLILVVQEKLLVLTGVAFKETSIPLLLILPPLEIILPTGTKIGSTLYE